MEGAAKGGLLQAEAMDPRKKPGGFLGDFRLQPARQKSVLPRAEGRGDVADREQGFGGVVGERFGHDAGPDSVPDEVREGKLDGEAPGVDAPVPADAEPSERVLHDDGLVAASDEDDVGADAARERGNAGPMAGAKASLFEETDGVWRLHASSTGSVGPDLMTLAPGLVGAVGRGILEEHWRVRHAAMAERIIDLRSDTFTQPTDEMREAMAKARVGDDVYGEDPTVNELEALAAERMGKEAALYMPSGTMVNQVAVWVHTGRRGALVCDSGAHIYYYEGGAPSLLSNVMVYPIEGRRGVFTPKDIEPFLHEDPAHYAPVRLVSIENTNARAGGTCWTAAQTNAVADYCRGRKIPTHLDGARIFHAAIAQGVPVTKLTERVDSVGFCVSKGLSAPVGSLLCGSKAFIAEARHARKIMGGGMRQAGIIAAAGIIALEKMVDRLREDHENARRLAAGLAKIDGVRVDLDTVQTNIVNFDIENTGHALPAFLAQLEKRGVRAMERDVGPVVRLVTHRHITRKDVDATIAAVRDLVAAAPGGRGVRQSSQTR